MALAEFAMIDANGGMTSATADMTTAATVEYCATNTHAMMQRPRQVPIITKYTV